MQMLMYNGMKQHRKGINMREDQKEVLKAWIDGVAIQYQSTDGSWGDCHDYGECERVFFNDCSVYRIKPKNIVTTTYIERTTDGRNLHNTYSDNIMKRNLKLTWSTDGKTLIKAEVI